MLLDFSHNILISTFLGTPKIDFNAPESYANTTIGWHFIINIKRSTYVDILINIITIIII